MDYHTYPQFTFSLRTIRNLAVTIVLFSLLIFAFGQSALATNGPTGNALDFDGSNQDYVDLGNIGLNTTQHTIEFWVKVHASPPADMRIMSVRSGTTNDFTMRLSNGKIQTWPNWVDVTSSTIPVDTWTHIAITRNGNSVTGFVNGVQELTNTNTANSYNNLALGHNFLGSHGSFFDGQLDEVRFWNEVRTQTEIQANMNTILTGNENNLIAYYQFDQGVAGANNGGITTLDDETSNNFDGTLTNFALNGATSNWVYTGQPIPPPPAPGGIPSDLQLWLKADAGTTTQDNSGGSGTSTDVNVWADQSANARDVTQDTAANQPNLQQGLVNGYPGINFNNSEGDFLRNVTSGLTADGPFTSIGVFIPDNNIGNSGPWNGNDGSPAGPGLRFESNIFRIRAGEDNATVSYDGAPLGKPALHTARYTAAPSPASSLNVLRTTGLLTATSTNTNTFSTGALKIGVGLFSTTLEGQMLEQIIYNRALTDTEIRTIESYLALKYGMTLDSSTDYVDSNSTVIYPSTSTHSSYTNDIAGFGVDDGSDLSQLVSQSINSESMVSIEDNGANTNNGEFLIWGNDAGALTGLAQVPSGYAERLARVWRVAETGDTGNVDVTFSLLDVDGNFQSAEELALLIDDDGDFSNASVATTGAPGDGLVYFGGVDFDDGDYFTLAYLAPDLTLEVDTFIDNLNDTCDDEISNDCSLRGAISHANNGTSPYTITVPTGTYTLTLVGAGEDANTTGDLDVAAPITFVGDGDGQTIIDANGIDRVFDLQSDAAEVTFAEMTIRGGNVTGDGGGIYNVAADVTLENTSLLDNFATGDGGAIYDSGGNIILRATGGSNYTIESTIDGSNGLSKEGAGLYILTGNNTYFGETYIDAGTLQINHAQGLGPQTPLPTNGTEVADGASLVINATGQFQEPLILNGAGVGNAGALQFTNAPAVTEPIVLASDSTIGQHAGGTPNIGAVISGAGSLTKVGTGTLLLSETATYSGTTVINKGTLTVNKAGGVIPNLSAVTVASGSGLNLNNNVETIGSLAGGGLVNLGSGTLIAGDDHTDTTYSGLMLGAGGNLTKLGSGTLTLTGNNTYTGVTSVFDGVLLVNGSIVSDVAVTGGILGGTGTVGGTTVVSGGSTISPGASPEILNAGSIVFDHESTLKIEIEGETPGAGGHDQLNVTGSIFIATIDGAGVDLTVTVSEGFTPTIGNTFVIVQNDGTDAITGTFAGLSEGATVSSDFGGSGKEATISYIGGDGNDIVITVEDPLQTSPFTVNTTDDSNGACTQTHCSLREAIEAANDSSGADQINFNIAGAGPHTIAPIEPLPEITDPVTIDGTTQPGAVCSSWPPTLQIALDGTNADVEGEGETLFANGLVLSGGNSTIRGLAIHSFSLDGITINTNGGNTLSCNAIGTDTLGTAGLGNVQAGVVVYAGNNTIGGTNPQDGNLIVNNGDDGVAVISGSGTAIRSNSVYNNGLLGIELAGDGVTTVDLNDNDVGANDLQNMPVLYLAEPASGSTNVQGLMHSTATTTFDLDFYVNTTCDPSSYGEGETFLETISVSTDGNGDFIFTDSLSTELTEGQFVTATATDPNGNTSEFSQCVRVGPDNTSWPKALSLSPNNTDSIDQFIDRLDQARWYKFDVSPNSQVTVNLSNLPKNYDLFVFTDISTAFEDINAPQDLHRLSAEFAPSAFNPSAFNPSAFNPSAFNPSAFNPSAFNPSAFNPSLFSPSAFNPSAFNPSAFNPSAFNPSAFNPSAFNPSAFNPSAFNPSAFNPSAFNPSAFNSAQTRSLIGTSSFVGTASESVTLNTWNNTGQFYIMVRGNNGVFDLTQAFHLEITVSNVDCNISAASLPANSHTATAGNYKTIILTDKTRNSTPSPFFPGTTILEGTLAEIAAMEARLNDLAALSEVQGVVVDVGTDARVAAANVLADNNTACPYAKNLVGQAIKNIIDDYRDLNPDLEYVVLIGNDELIPFFRYPDTTLLGNEENYVPPVIDASHSQASLRLGYVLSQDTYGSMFNISLKGNQFPIPYLAVGRLVETATEITGMIDAYINGTTGGVVPTPDSSFVTGYDFLTDSSIEVFNELQAGINQTPDSLIALADQAPAVSWSATDLSNLLLNNRYDVTYLSGHFSANNALAADYSTSLLTTEFVSSPVDMTNMFLMSTGCHSGYNIVNQHGVPGVTLLLDWPQAFAQKKVTAVIGTGYQYGDTDFIEYSERLYLELNRQLRVGNVGEPVAIGKALVEAKKIYLSETPKVEGLHEKAVLEATLFGLPMFSMVMPGERIAPDSSSSIVASTTPFGTNPGSTLGLDYADIVVDATLTTETNTLKNLDDDSNVTATYVTGANGLVTNPIEPTLPLEVRDVTPPNNKVLRGVGFRGGIYNDMFDVIPLTGAPTTEIRGLHTPFLSDVFFPLRPWFVNYFEALQGGSTKLMVTPAQHQSSFPGSLTSTLRKFDQMSFRVYYSDNVQTYGGGSVPALAAPPTISTISAIPDNAGNVDFKTLVTGNPAAGIQEVWITYSDYSAPYPQTWQSLSLTQNGSNSTLWEGTLNLGGTAASDIRFMIQAVNGVGLVTLDSNVGAYYIPQPEQASQPTPPQPTILAFDPPLAPDASGAYGTAQTFRAILTSNGNPVAGKIIRFGLGSQSQFALTDANGRVSTTMTLLGIPDQYELSATFSPTPDFEEASATTPFEITQQGTVIALEIQPGSSGQPTIIATLQDNNGNPLLEQTIFFIITGDGGSFSATTITNLVGQAILSNIPLPDGSYTVQAYFNGQIPIPGQGVVTLSNDSYNPAFTEAPLTLARDLGSITIIKQVGDESTHPFQFTGDLSNFTLTSNSATSQTTFSEVAAGNYTVSEDPTSFPDAFWALLAVTCYDLAQPEQGVAVTTDLFNYTADIPLLPGQDLACTFLNDRANFNPGDQTHRLYLPIVVK